jgi:hypothetical protein
MAVVIVGAGVAALYLVVDLVVRGAPLEPPLPPILQKVTASGGWISACPPADDTEARMRGTMELAISPEFDARLMKDFPSGTRESTLIEALTSRGFKVLEPCRSDLSVRRASFRQRGGGGLAVYPMTAIAYWKVDEANVVEWTRGFVFFTAGIL